MTLEIITAESLQGVTHGFFTRKGGASSGVFGGLNCGYGSSDQSDMVAINRSRVATAMGVDVDRLQTVDQVHSAEVITLTRPLNGALPKADAMVAATPGLALAILTADCQPVLLADTHAAVVGAVHAGWRGALDGILESTVASMVALGAQRDRIKAAIGPSISQRAYEVGPDFFDRFRDEDPESLRFFANANDDRMLFDLPGYGLHRLRAAGIAEASWTGHCTYTDPERFYSYRRSVHARQADYGRLISVIRL